LIALVGSTVDNETGKGAQGSFLNYSISRNVNSDKKKTEWESPGNYITKLLNIHAQF
jgi:hypothetical protein